jgi:hypothetical protein
VASIHVQYQEAAAGGDGERIGPGRRLHRRQCAGGIGGGFAPTFQSGALLRGDHGHCCEAQGREFPGGFKKATVVRFSPDRGPLAGEPVHLFGCR